MSLYNIILFVIYKILYDDIFRAKKKRKEKKIFINRKMYIYVRFIWRMNIIERMYYEGYCYNIFIYDNISTF